MNRNIVIYMLTIKIIKEKYEENFPNLSVILLQWCLQKDSLTRENGKIVKGNKTTHKNTDRSKPRGGFHCDVRPLIKKLSAAQGLFPNWVHRGTPTAWLHSLRKAGELGGSTWESVEQSWKIWVLETASLKCPARCYDGLAKAWPRSQPTLSSRLLVSESLLSVSVSALSLFSGSF